MSHVSKVDIHIKDLESLKKVCEDLGLELVEGQETYEWYGQWMDDWNDDRAAAMDDRYDPKDFGKCKHAIKLAGCDYEIGVVEHHTGVGYDLLFDNWGPGKDLARKLGDGLEALRKGYAVEVTKKQLKMKGIGFTETLNIDGSVKIVGTVLQ